MPLEQISPEVQQALAADAAAVQQRAVADARKRRDELIQEARRIAEHERQRLLAQTRKRALHRSSEERARGLRGAAGEARRQLATVRETSACAERLKELAREAAEILSAAAEPAQPRSEAEQLRSEDAQFLFALSLSKRQESPSDRARDGSGPSTGSGQTGWAAALVVVDPRELGLAVAGFGRNRG